MLRFNKSLYTRIPKEYPKHNIRIGAFSIIETDKAAVVIGENVSIGHHVLIESNVILSDHSIIDSYCRICWGTKIGLESQVLYGASVFEDVLIGNRCIIGGELCDRSILGNNVTFMGKTIHSYRRPGEYDDWDRQQQPSPIIGNNVVIGEEALIVGEVKIGDGSYIGAGEIVKCEVPPKSLFLHNRIIPIIEFKGFIEARM